ncbi:MAG: hypothetical protein QM645_05790 [Asticcacaulis sp.]
MAINFAAGIKVVISYPNALEMNVAKASLLSGICGLPDGFRGGAGVDKTHKYHEQQQAQKNMSDFPDQENGLNGIFDVWLVSGAGHAAGCSKICAVVIVGQAGSSIYL